MDESVTDGDILMAVQELVASSAQPDRMRMIDVSSAENSLLGNHAIEGREESRVEKIRARVRELNEKHGDEMTPMAMFDLIMREFRT